MQQLDDLEMSRAQYVDNYIMKNDKPVGFDTLAYEQGLIGMPNPAGVDFRTFLRQKKEDNKEDERYMEWSRIQHGESDHDTVWCGHMERHPAIVRTTGYDTPNAKTDSAPHAPAVSMQRNITSAYAQKRGFHEGWNPNRLVEDEVEVNTGSLRVTKLKDNPDGVEVDGNFVATEPHIPYVVSHGMDGLQLAGWQLPDHAWAQKIDASHKHVGADDVGFDHGGPFRAGHKRFVYHNHMANTAHDMDNAVEQADPEYVPAEADSTENAEHASSESQKHRLATQEGGFRALSNRGAVGGAIEKEVQQIL